MALTPAQIATLRTELTTDPIGYGYAARVAAGDHVGLADLLNLVRTGSNGGPAIVVRRTDIRPSDIVECIGIANWRAMGANAAERTSDQNYLIMIASLSNRIELINADGSNTRVLDSLQTIYASLPATLARINAVTSRQGSRAEQRFGPGVVVTLDDVAAALG